MKYLKQFFTIIVIPVAAVWAVSCGYDQGKTSNHVCQFQYALCTSALCVPQPNNPEQAICFCDVEEGKSMSTVPCHTIQPSTDANGIRNIYSTFSLDQFKQGKKAMKCPNGTPWTWCLNKQCTIDPANSKKAICVCDVVRNTGEWMTLGGNCDTSTCETGYWSGAAIKDFDEGNVFMTKAMGWNKSPAKWCQAESP